MALHLPNAQRITSQWTMPTEASLCSNRSLHILDCTEHKDLHILYTQDYMIHRYLHSKYLIPAGSISVYRSEVPRTTTPVMSRYIKGITRLSHVDQAKSVDTCVSHEL